MNTNMSPKATARLAGALLLATMVGGGVAQGFIGGQLIAPGDAAATAANFIAHAPLARLAFAVYLIEMACDVAMTVLFYELLKPVSKSASLLGATFGLVGCTIKTLSRLFFFAPLLVVGGAHYLSVFEPKQLEALAFLSLRLQYQAETIAMVFFGLSTVVTSWLVYRSGFLPRFLGVIGVVGGLGWMIYLYEPLAERLEGYIVGVAVIGAFAQVVWLLAKGVNEERWRDRARLAAASSI